VFTVQENETYQTKDSRFDVALLKIILLQIWLFDSHPEKKKVPFEKLN